jgi:hypothetical protein
MAYFCEQENTSVTQELGSKNAEMENLQSQISQLRQACLDELLFCNCCGIDGRHTKNKPAVYAPWVETKPWSHVTHSPTGPDVCKCRCRHEARMICRDHPLYRPDEAYPKNLKRDVSDFAEYITRMAYTENHLDDHSYKIQKIKDSVWG